MIFSEPDGFYCWRVNRADVHVYFGGKGPSLGREAALRRILPRARQPAWLRQVHSSTIINAQPGDNGEGDSLVRDRKDLALSVVTADCVPVLLTAGRQLAAVHAGWRGLVKAILPATLDRLTGPAADITAWIGPAIGPCCYEVGRSVADQVVAASSERIARPGPSGRPHLDLVAAARCQLEARGVRTVHSLGVCTRCDEARLWSYRRDGPKAGRNIAVIWKS